METNKTIKTFAQHLDNRYGKTGTEKRIDDFTSEMIENPNQHECVNVDNEESSHILDLRSTYHDKINTYEHNVQGNNIAITDCEQITFGDKIYCNGPVTIMVDKDNKNNASLDGVINKAFNSSEKYSSNNGEQVL